MALYKSPQVQTYLNGLPAKDLYSDKAIYQHGRLRKVRSDIGLIDK